MPPHLLVVEDSPTQARVVRRVLESAGYEIELARSGEEGLALFDAERCDAVIDDIAVRPVAVRMLEARGYRVVSTSNGEDAFRIIEDGREPIDLQGLLERGVALAHKPFTAESLGQKVREVLDRCECNRVQTIRSSR